MFGIERAVCISARDTAGQAEELQKLCDELSAVCDDLEVRRGNQRWHVKIGARKGLIRGFRFSNKKDFLRGKMTQHPRL